ncbi:50S ribosomal protein L18 [Candidatus Pacearchaeota archaeon]|nr:50S ribosomal protein L18 [Candidatus Pacearchaeota archaeon]|tara:strand:+ start:31055 stop:31543 length:489 start_codon:yes stop_codon:yes gene_type:complete
MVGLRTQKKRRRQAKTDYKLRLNLLKSETARIVIRRTNKYFIAQVTESHESQDKVLMTVSSKDLIKNGWDEKMKGSLKSVPAGYLTGLLLAKKLDDKKYIVDLGMARTIPGNRIFSVIKGLVDGGAKISVNEKMFPSEERIRGEHLKEEVKTMTSKVAGKLK